MSCCTASEAHTLGNARSETSIIDKSPSDLPKVNNFKIKCRKLTIANKMEKTHRLDILNEALADFGITEEPIKRYYSMGEVMGAGKYGVVKAGKSVSKPGYKVAIKIIKLEKLKSQYHSIVQEILALKKIDHPNVVKIHEIFKDSKKLYIVMEMVEGKELFDFVVQKMKLNEPDASKIAYQLIKTIKYLNEQKLCHRDLKPENIIIHPETLNIKIIDFGLSAFYSEFAKLSTKVGTPYYVAPEVLEKSYGKECDMWSIGVITYVLLTGCPPFQAKSLPELFRRIKACNLKYIDQDFKNLSKESYHFVKSCLCVDPSQRITPEEALKHKWILQMKVEEAELTDR
jgi:serine/threonine protein kinase